MQRMTQRPLKQINLLDTDYADILANSSDPPFELQLVRLGWMQQKPASKPISSPAVHQKPETPEEWAALTEAWFVACEYTPNFKDFQLIVEFLWENQDSVEVEIDC